MKIQGLPPIVQHNSRVLILGSMPGATSLRLKQYYGNKTNQFWKILASLLKVKTPTEYRDKKAMLHSARIALWDVLKSCDRKGSSDSSIGRAFTNDIPKLVKKKREIRLILLNGRVAEKYFKDTIASTVKIPCYYVPSTSSAHAGINLHKKIAQWNKAFKKFS